MGTPNVYRWESLPREEVREGVSRTAFRGEGALMVMNWLQPGMEKKPHSHPFEQLAYILSGRVRFEIGDDVVEVGAGEVVRIPPDVVHCGEVVGDETAINLDVFAPTRDDYLHLTAYQEPDFQNG
ncbi:cupin domain-containing protein [Pseudooceanicola sediminis]|uniref:Cupin domain-containing protein n=1 Tax=Pseudooceanicola sediminis TaxID=2211117 RepID=A0A399J6M6_9RHOB|nr:cupin domain-containing protein [Pseudooceanicola sediminis]KAA2317288.1 cupin domain-containing protein [Puniceibacterium sp. HSS470]RII39642.1 cupin domain-containing protein [Pseudooceanicola sediminis]|tara:strand:- start:20097 stop:20471 length:375 start_codon:yes stop_codon:yes gene_type:complete